MDSTICSKGGDGSPDVGRLSIQQVASRNQEAYIPMIPVRL